MSGKCLPALACEAPEVAFLLPVANERAVAALGVFVVCCVNHLAAAVAFKL